MAENGMCDQTTQSVQKRDANGKCLQNLSSNIQRF